jgi:2-polyprenyl-3-methyl-5-hydroxy-6-metoxy-1,4-benzoquinol methylase
MGTPLYDALSDDYDRFVAWRGRLAYELPFIEKQLAAAGARSVLDVACGTGMHAIALAERGYRVTGTDVSVGMIERARLNANSADLEIPFVAAGFGELSDRLEGSFDALLCLGNSLPHVLTMETLRRTLEDFAAVLRPGGLLLIQNRNFDAVIGGGKRWMEPQAYREGDREWLFVRFYDFSPDGTLTFNVLTLQRDEEGDWSQRAEATRLRPWLHADYLSVLADTGFGAVTSYGDMTGSPFDPAESGNLILTATRGPSQNGHEPRERSELYPGKDRDCNPFATALAG